MAYSELTFLFLLLFLLLVLNDSRHALFVVSASGRLFLLFL
jgi:hypothetical protein